MIDRWMDVTRAIWGEERREKNPSKCEVKERYVTG